MSTARILVVDDEQDLVWALMRSLSDEGYDVFAAYDGVEALANAQRHPPDVVILDINMPRLDGVQVCQSLRRDAALAAVRILFLTVRNDIEDRVEGLDNGADDYLAKPFDLMELKARVRALLRRGRFPSPDGSLKPEDQGFIVEGPLTLDLRMRQVRVGENRIQLTPTEFILFRHLMIHAGEVFSSGQLLQLVWGYPMGTADAGLVRWHIRNLRAKIDPDPGHPVYIRTLPRHGYLLDIGSVA